MIGASLLLALLQGPQPAQEAPPVPRLVVLICVDQLRENQLDRLSPVLTGGLHRLLEEGQRFRGARLGYLITETGPGHVTLGSGCLPDKSGVLANQWRVRGNKDLVYCVGGPADRLGVGGSYEASGRDATNLRRPALGEILGQRWPNSKVIAISGKDRGAIGLGGRTADACLWWDKGGRGWVTSTAFGESLPPWAAAASRGWVHQAAGWTWNVSFDAKAPPPGTQADQRPGEVPLPGGDGTLPWSLPQPADRGDSAERAKLAGRVYAVPLLDALALQLGREALQAEDLGLDGSPDLLCLALSSCDSVGHRFGPKSREVTDLLLRLDRDLGVMFDLLDRRLGADSWIACLSADHGVLDLPEQRLEENLPGLRVSKGELGRLRGVLRDHLKETLKSSCKLTIVGHAVWMNADDVRAAGGDLVQVRRQLAELVREHAPWADLVFTNEELTAHGAAGILGLAQASYQESTAPDLLIHTQPGTLLGLSRGTSHGSAHEYDRSVPLIFMGTPFTPGEHTRSAGPEDAVPTLLRALGWTAQEIEAFGFDGQSLLP